MIEFGNGTQTDRTCGMLLGSLASHARLDDSAVHVWRADLDDVGMQLSGLLDAGERERAAQIVREPARQRWIAARGVLRAILGSYLQVNPSVLRFADEGGHGKPALAQPGDTRLCFNLSHSGPLALYAVTEMGAIGVDVELVGPLHRPPPPDRGALAQRLPGEPTAKRLGELDPHPRRLEFLRAWVRHEANGKRLGIGVGSTFDPARAVGGWPWTTELDVGDGAVAALALRKRSVDFQVYVIDFPSYGSILPKDTINMYTTNQTFPCSDTQKIPARDGRSSMR